MNLHSVTIHVHIKYCIHVYVLAVKSTNLMRFLPLCCAMYVYMGVFKPSLLNFDHNYTIRVRGWEIITCIYRSL